MQKLKKAKLVPFEHKRILGICLHIFFVLSYKIFIKIIVFASHTSKYNI